MSRAPLNQRNQRTLADLLTDPALLAALSRFVGARVPGSEVDDIVQSVVAEALVAREPPAAEEDVARWVHGIARHRVVDWFRRNRREVPQDPEFYEAAGAEDTSAEARDLYRWARRELPEGDEHAKTLEWMLREGAGEKLESIAADVNLPAPRVRQRVSRLRRHYKARWAAQAAALATLLVVIVAIVLARRKKEEPVAPFPAPSASPWPAPTIRAPEATPEERAADLREDALKKCDAAAWQECLEGLDAARGLDPAGEAEPRVANARARAHEALAPKPAPAPLPTPPRQTSMPGPTSGPMSAPAPLPKPRMKGRPSKAPSFSDAAGSPAPAPSK